MDIILQIRECSLERDWNQFDTPRNLTLAIMGEVGELADLFQFKGDYMTCGGGENGAGEVDEIECCGLQKDGWSVEKIDKVRQEIADVAIYCLRLIDVLGMEDKVSIEKKD